MLTGGVRPTDPLTLPVVALVISSVALLERAARTFAFRGPRLLAGYSPACANEGVGRICEKPRIKCSECPHQRFLPVTDEVIRWHLSGLDGRGRGLVMGIYAILQDETCFFLAADFDKAAGQDDAGAFLETCRPINVPAVLERSRSGHSGHLSFFDEAIPAGMARKLGRTTGAVSGL